MTDLWFPDQTQYTSDFGFWHSLENQNNFNAINAINEQFKRNIFRHVWMNIKESLNVQIKEIQKITLFSGWPNRGPVYFMALDIPTKRAAWNINAIFILRNVAFASLAAKCDWDSTYSITSKLNLK